MPPVASQPDRRGSKFAVDDSLIIGELVPYARKCDACQQSTTTVKILSVCDEIDQMASTKLLIYRPDTNGPYPKIQLNIFIGIGCGCYGKFHRQIAHIRQKQRDR